MPCDVKKFLSYHRRRKLDPESSRGLRRRQARHPDEMMGMLNFGRYHMARQCLRVLAVIFRTDVMILPDGACRRQGQQRVAERQTVADLRAIGRIYNFMRVLPLRHP